MSEQERHGAGGNGDPTLRAIVERRQILWLAALVLLVGLVGGLLGGALSARVFKPVQSAPRLGVVNLTRLMQASASAALKDPAAAATFSKRFEQGVAQLVESDPHLILLVKEAVVGGSPLQDYTDAFLPPFDGTAAPASSGGAARPVFPSSAR